MKTKAGILKDKMLDDLFAYGICASKTEIINGRVHIRYIDPMSDELREAMYNAEHKDSQMRIDVMTTDEILSMNKELEH